MSKATIVGIRLVHFEMVFQRKTGSTPIVVEVVGHKIAEDDNTVTVQFTHPVTHLPERIKLMK